MREEKSFTAGITAKITEQSVIFTETVLGTAVREWGYDKSELEKSLRELAEYREKIKCGDLVEVVRCKDCKHFISDRGYAGCQLHEHISEEYGYCRWAKRREPEGR